MNIILENLLEKPKNYSITLNKPGKFYYICYGFGDVEKNVEIHIESDGVEAYIFGLFIGQTGQCRIQTLQHHREPSSMSSLHIKSILSGDASFNYCGNIKIEKQAQQSNAYQKNDNLIMSANAHVDTKPELEIIANDVRCSHGATIGQLNEEALYYMQSRGVSREHASRLALHGFAQDVIMKIPDDESRKEADKYIKHEIVNIFESNR